MMIMCVTHAIWYVSASVNGHAVQLSTIISDNDLICHKVHRHEPPVTSLPIQILHEDSQLVVVNKPSSIPVR